MSTRILIVDDSAAVRSAVRACLQLSPELDICGEAVNGQTAVELVRQLAPDIVLLDYHMPVLDGLEAAQQIARIAPRTTIFLFTMSASEELYRFAAMIAIHAVVSKGAGGVEEIVRLIANLHRDLDSTA
jgi:DNA-binding NarL/FixJ family response regulator